jgi:putative membrane protein
MGPTITTILPRRGSGLSVLLLHLLTTLALLALGALCDMGVTPLRERAMIEADNVAAATALVGVQIAIALLNAAAMAG